MPSMEREFLQDSPVEAWYKELEIRRIAQIEEAYRERDRRIALREYTIYLRSLSQEDSTRGEPRHTGPKVPKSRSVPRKYKKRR